MMTFHKTINRCSQRRSRSGFTLVELLIVIVMIGLVSGMAVSAYQGVAQTSRAARTRAIIATINSVLQENYDSYKHRPLAVEIPDLSTPNIQNGEYGLEVLAMESARVRLAMIRDLQRIEVPDRLSDFYSLANLTPQGPAFLQAAVNPVELDGNNNLVRVDKNRRRMLPVNSPPSTKLQSYVARVQGNRDGQGNLVAPTETNQGAECLFLIMSTTFIGGSPAIEGIPSSNIGDTDGDRLNEILDGWGRPLAFIRWPVGYIDPNGGVDRTMADDFDPLRVDYAHAEYANQQNPNQMIPPPAAQVWNAETGGFTKPFSMRPLVVSAGSDGILGIETNPAGNPSFSYLNSYPWMVDQNHYGIELQGRAGQSAYDFPDPYLRNYTNANTSNGVFTGVLPGQTLANATAIEDRADNITNFDPQE